MAQWLTPEWITAIGVVLIVVLMIIGSYLILVTQRDDVFRARIHRSAVEGTLDVIKDALGRMEDIADRKLSYLEEMTKEEFLRGIEYNLNQIKNSLEAPGGISESQEELGKIKTSLEKITRELRSEIETELRGINIQLQEMRLQLRSKEKSRDDEY